MAQREGEVYALVGDGTYMMNPTELATALQENWKITVVISENHGYQSIHRLQKGRAGHSFGNEFRSRDGKANRLDGAFLAIDFAKNAESMGARVWRIGGTDADAVRQALRDARRETRSCVIVVETEKYRFPPPSEVWWDVAPAEATQDPITRELRAQYEKDRANLQRYYY
jgi:3D-(3,5/4)-trihydroxycyclohexane-1,2-dione acylhydrolase (decyclizing)